MKNQGVEEMKKFIVYYKVVKGETKKLCRKELQIDKENIRGKDIWIEAFRLLDSVEGLDNITSIKIVSEKRDFYTTNGTEQV